MVINTYGKTAWGKAFLDALGRMDMDARLGRGKSYANTGKVIRISITGSQVIAKVQGQMLYQVAVLFQDFRPEEKEMVFSIIEKNPLLYGHIINGELPPELIGLLQKANIKLFPQRWSDMHARCSCPDYGNPCKHMAAVYFLITSEIDKNPFTLFALHGVDLVQHFNIKVTETEPKYPLPVISSDVGMDVTVESVESSGTTDLQKCDLLKIPSMAGFILDCLSSNPPFSSQLDFKEVMTEFYGFVAKKGQETLLRLSGRKDSSFLADLDLDDLQRILSQSEFNLPLDENFNMRTIWIHNDLWNEKLDPNSVFKKVPFTEESVFQNGCMKKWVKMDIWTAMQIIWKPLYTCGTVEEQLKNLARLYPDEPCVALDDCSLDGKSAGLHFTSVVMTRYVKEMNFMHKKLKNNPPKESRSFFGGATFSVISLAEQSIPKSISKYFGVFNLMKTDFEVSVHIDQLIQESSFSKKGYDDLDLGMGVVDTYTMGLWMSPKTSDNDDDDDDDGDADSLAVRTFMKQYPNSRNQVLKFLSTLAPYLNNVDRLMISDSVTMSTSDLETFILETVRIFTNLGVKVALPKELKKVLKPKAVVHAESREELSGKSHQTFFNLHELLSYNWKISIGDELVSPEEFEKMVRGSKRLVKFKDKFMMISPEEMRNILSSVEKPLPKVSALDLLKESLVDDSNFHVSSDINGFLKSMTRVTDFTIPVDLNATLRDYQVNGFRWIVSNLQNGFGVILADDMGLGKTIQTIATVLHLKTTGHLTKPVLLVVPTSVMSNWEREVRRFAPSLTTEKYYGSARALPVDDQSASVLSDLNSSTANDGTSTPKPKRRKIAAVGGSSDIIMTTYQLLWRDVDVLQKMKFGMIVIDEAQHIKNFKSQTFKALKKIKAPMRVALSGTPVENKLSELWSVFEFAIPKYLGSIKEFSEKIAKPIELERDPVMLAKLKSISAPFLMRRLKTDKNVIKDLPEKVIDNKYVNLSTEQAVLYESLVQEMMKSVLECKERKERNKYIFKVLTHLKQICNHPANYISSKKATIDSSGKMKMLVELLEPILQQGEKVLIFTQYVQMIHLMVQMLENHFHVKPLVLEGSMSQAKRDEAINAFKTKAHRQIFIISLKAGGTGLNLTEANHVIHYDLWYNPAVENQATDRAFRIGQQKTVFVYRMITEKTFEEKIDQMIIKKKDLSDLSVNVGEQWIGNMSDQELRNLFSRA
ncbi:uncharacterized ATP-dependent helicase YwqA-like isoform X2 [Ptychodera flava]|uniref:uncharacterized ATP-dependent helicase YwqA-like isoform X2 n=1 Tax=Ptychodera flava TaxID=63121 RepID=UPI00396A8110